MFAVLERLHRHCGILLLLIATVTVAWKASQQYAPPVGEKSVAILSPGGADLYMPWASARALLDHKDPYHTPLGDPWGRGGEMEGRQVYIFYPPGTITFHVPFAYFFNDPVAAASVLFDINFAAAIGLSFVTWWILRYVRTSLGKDDTPIWLVFPIFCVLALSKQTAYAFERGQIDLLMSLLCWSGLLLFFRGQTFAALFLIAIATHLKPYPALFGLGLGLLSLNAQRWKGAVGGTAAASLLLLLPMYGHLAMGFKAVGHRADLMCPPFSHGFSEFFRAFSPANIKPGANVMMVVTLLVAVGCWWCAWRNNRGGRPLWLTIFSVFALLPLIAYQPCSCPYNFTVPIPGLLIWAACAPEAFEAVGFSRAASTVLSLLQAVPICLMFLMRIEEHSATAIGIVIYILLNGAALTFAVVRDKRSELLRPAISAGGST